MKYLSLLFLLTLPYLTFASDKLDEAEKIDFEKEVYPILKDRCVSCHGPDKEKNGKTIKAKAALRLDSLTAILQGGEGGAVIKRGDPEKSSLYYLTVLEEDDDDIMPAKGKPLTKAQTELIKNWIIQGADFGTWKGVQIDKQKAWTPITESPFNKTVDKLEKSTKYLSKTEVKKLLKKGYVVQPLAEDSKLLYVDLRYSDIKTTSKNFSNLSKVYHNIHTLNLSKTEIDDSVFKLLSKCKSLVNLNLSSTKITGKGIDALKYCENLETLNISNTQFKKNYKSSLNKIKSIKSLYSWNVDI